MNPQVSKVALPEGYIETVKALLLDRRPELLKPRKGRMAGPFIDPRCAGLVFKIGKLLIIASPWDTSDDDSGLWLHVSVSRQDRTPNYEELSEVRKRMFRPTDTVLHVWPPEDEHFNLHPNCLHLWTPMDGSRPIPDLRGDGGGV